MVYSVLMFSCVTQMEESQEKLLQRDREVAQFQGKLISTDREVGLFGS